MSRLTVATPRGLAVGMDQRIEHRKVIGTMAGRLHDHVARKAEMIAQGVELLFGSIAGRVFALRRKGEFRSGTEHVAMRVHGASRHLESGL